MSTITGIARRFFEACKQGKAGNLPGVLLTQSKLHSAIGTVGGRSHASSLYRLDEGFAHFYAGWTLRGEVVFDKLRPA